MRVEEDHGGATLRRSPVATSYLNNWEKVWRNLLALLDEQEKLKWAKAFLVGCSNRWHRVLSWHYRTTESKGAAKR